MHVLRLDCAPHAHTHTHVHTHTHAHTHTHTHTYAGLIWLARVTHTHNTLSWFLAHTTHQYHTHTHTHTHHQYHTSSHMIVSQPNLAALVTIPHTHTLQHILLRHTHVCCASMHTHTHTHTISSHNINNLRSRLWLALAYTCAPGLD
jgi:hypothetical protein